MGPVDKGILLFGGSIFGVPSFRDVPNGLGCFCFFMSGFGVSGLGLGSFGVQDLRGGSKVARGLDTEAKTPKP